MLCSTCTTCFISGDRESKLRSHIHAPLPHHETFDAFVRSVEESCIVCRAVWRSTESRGGSLRREQSPLTQFSLQSRRKVGGSKLSKSAKVITIYWQERGERFQELKAFSLELVKDIVCSANRSNEITLCNVVNNNLSLPSHWFWNCVNHHQTCNTAKTFIPTRLIDVGNSATCWNLRVTAECSGDFCRYATLSHRWSSDNVLCLTTSTMEAFKKGLALSALSPTFQYAAATAKNLGIRYLWIDSLCIVQDSMEDWRSESSLMSSVYGHSVLTIAMLSIRTQVGRLSDDSANISSLICQIKPRWTDVASEDCYIFEDSMWKDCVSFAPLNRRAWVLQERILSKRILYVHKTQYFWECHQQTACELFPVQMPPQMRCMPGDTSHKEARPSIEQISLDHHDNERNPYFFWSRVIEKYTVCELTRAEDKLIAVSGLAQRVAAIANDTYLAGLWARHLETQLMWSVQDPPTAKLPIPVSPENPRYRAPSWSWASVDGKVLLRTPHTDDDILELVNMVSADVKTVTEDRTSQVQNGFLTVTGVLIPAAYHLDASRSSGGRLVVASMRSSKEFNIFVDFDVHPNEAVEDLLCLPFFHYLSPEADGEKGIAGVEGLVLRKNCSSTSCYFRVGIFAMHGRPLCQLAGLEFGDRPEGEMGQVSSTYPTQILVIA